MSSGYTLYLAPEPDPKPNPYPKKDYWVQELANIPQARHFLTGFTAHRRITTITTYEPTYQGISDPERSVVMVELHQLGLQGNGDMQSHINKLQKMLSVY